MHTLPAKKVSAYLAVADEHSVLPLFFLDLTMDIRRSELAPLLWADLDVEN